MTIVLDTISHTLQVTQTIEVTNSSNKTLSKLVLNDWNHAYSDKYSPLGKRFSDEYVRAFHFAPQKERGNTLIKSLLVNHAQTAWNRVDNHLDIIEIELKSALEPNQSTTLEIQYDLKIPDAKFTRFGYSDGNYYLKNCFLSLARLSEEGQFTYYSNENLEDIANATNENIELEFILPKQYNITTNFNLTNQTETQTNKVIAFSSKNVSEVQFAIEKNVSFESFKNETIEVETNLADARINGIQRAIVIDKVINYMSHNLGTLEVNKIMISKADYDRNPFYGLNQLPAFLSPFPDDFIYEIKFLKAYTYNYLKTSLKIDVRKDGYIFDAIQVYIMMKYIEDNYPNAKMLGNISEYKLFKGYYLTQVDFNEQYKYLYMLMARKNLDQPIGDSKETFIKFNEQIAGKYKAGLSFKYLNYYLQDSTVENSFREFIALNKVNHTNAADFEALLVKNSPQNIDWFFPTLIRSRKIIDYKFGPIHKSKDSISVTIKNNGEATTPISFSGIKDKKVVFKQWFSNIKTDTTFTISRDHLDKLVLNNQNEVPEFNLRNNYKSLRSIFSMNRPLKFNLLKDLENPFYNQIFYIPEIGFNLYDGAILSLNLQNKSLLDKPFIYDLNPSFSTTTASLTGSASFAINQQIRNSNLYGIRYGLAGSYFHYLQDAAYFKFYPSILFKFRGDDLRSNKKQFVTLRHIIVDKEKPAGNVVINTPLNYSVFDARYTFQNTEMVKGFALGTDLQFSKDFGKVSTEVSYRKLFENNYQVSLRLYAGSFLYKNTATDFFNFGLDRPKDYLFDYNYYGRSESSGFFSQQLILAEGGFKSKFKNPYANQWMTSFNATSSIWHWIQMYGDAGFYQNKGMKTKFVYDSGIHLNLVPDYFELFFPVYSTNGFEMQKNYGEKVRFIITISPKTLISLFTRKWF
ncbi:aminopeptidase [Flavobacterium sp.]|uniref:aminopeptidase n=1 Tax=Flavobacterium sp. TaxID=239 RepID=UPI0026204CA9|nr:aminopeptidase [Flavobacterium sp.]